MENNTFTVDTAPETATAPDNLTAEEQDSLALGESISQEQDTLLAGKYKNAEELEKAYKELEQKLGDQESPEQAEPEESETTSFSDNAELITSASDEDYANEGKLSPETLDKFKGLSSEELVNAYLEVSQSPDWQTGSPSANDLSESQINSVKTSVGGDEAYSNLVNWASNNLDAQSVQAFDDIMSNGNMGAIQLAVNGLKSQYEQANGYEGKMYTGKAPASNKDVFRSQAELVAAMNDSRYDRAPAYRQAIIEKLDRSDLNF